MDNTRSADLVLVVDDAPDALSLINDILEQAGFNVLVALEGRQALTIARRLRPDMVLLDALMPGMDGFETCRRLKADPELAGIPVIFMTGLSDTGSIVRGLEVGGVDYLGKPVKADELLARMKVHLDNARLASSARQALDATGQYLLSVASDGRLRWATPQAHALFARAGVSEEWCQTSMAGQLSRWLGHVPKVQQQLRFDDIDHPLGVVLIELRGPQEILLRLVDMQKISGADLLRRHLKLTARESEVLFWLSQGKANRDIAEILGISPRTVNKHLEQIFPNLGVENRTAAASVAIRLLTDHCQ
ncbi:MAG: response regulator transcription factor [Pseudomonadales bacterium]|nr:response regulator transcription factor [Pseudomonadales bacterium]